MIRTIVLWGLYWGPVILGNYHMSTRIPRAFHEDLTGIAIGSLASLCGYICNTKWLSGQGYGFRSTKLIALTPNSKLKTPELVNRTAST